MTKWMCLGAVAVLLITAVAGPWMLRHRVTELESAARALLDAPAHTEAFMDVTVRFSGQEARLTGTVAEESSRDLAASIIRNDVRIPGGPAASWNPVIGVKNQISVDPGWNAAHPQPWFSVFLLGNKAELHGVTKSLTQAEEIAGALRGRLPELELKNTATLVPGARPAADWAGTLASLPDREALAHAGARGVFLFSAGDGQWSTVDGSLAVSTQKALQAKAGADSGTADTVASEFSRWRDREAEELRVAGLPVATAGLLILPDRIQVLGTIASEDDRKTLIDELGKTFPQARLEVDLVRSRDVKPRPDWTTALASLPATPEAPMIAGLIPGKGALTWDGKGGQPAMKEALAAMAENSGALVPALWQRFTAYEDARRRAEISASILPPSPPPALPGNAGAFVGWTFANDRLSIFGVVPDEAAQIRVLGAAGVAFPGLFVDAAELRLDPRRSLSAGTGIHFEKLAVPPQPLIGITTFEGKSKVYAPDAYDIEIARDFRDVPVSPDDLAGMLRKFRETLASAGGLPREVPFLSLLSDGKTLRASGEVAAGADKEAVMNALRTGARGVDLVDGIEVTPVVSESGDMTPTLASLPLFPKGTRGVATVRPGQKWRVAVVHAIYFQTGSDRSKDQERALRQVREALKLLPGAHFEIVGHTDTSGDYEANLKLSTERAKTFQAYLIDAGIPRDLITSRGTGSDQPVAGNDSEQGRALNRRVDVILH